jgi:hypothetical protein
LELGLKGFPFGWHVELGWLSLGPGYHRKTMTPVVLDFIGGYFAADEANGRR